MRPAAQNTEPYSTKLSPEFLREVEALRIARGLSKAEVVREGLRLWVERNKPAE